jgi:hypothetical protein
MCGGSPDHACAAIRGSPYGIVGKIDLSPEAVGDAASVGPGLLNPIEPSGDAVDTRGDVAALGRLPTVAADGGDDVGLIEGADGVFDLAYALCMLKVITVPAAVAVRSW